MSDFDTPVFEGEIVNDQSPSFGVELAKTASINVAATAGTLVGFVLVGLASSKYRQVRANLAAKKAAKADTTVPTTEA